MAKIIQFTIPGTVALRRKQIERIRELWNRKLIIPPYCDERQECRGISTKDIKYTIFNGRIVSHEPQENRWRYVIKGKSIDGVRMKCVVDINGSLVIVTAFNLD